jgi:hypothetical protein
MINLQGHGVVLWTGLAYCDGWLYASHGEELTSTSALFRIDPDTGAETELFYLPTYVNDLSSCSASE